MDSAPPSMPSRTLSAGGLNALGFAVTWVILDSSNPCQPPALPEVRDALVTGGAASGPRQRCRRLSLCGPVQDLLIPPLYDARLAVDIKRTFHLCPGVPAQLLPQRFIRTYLRDLPGKRLPIALLRDQSRFSMR